VVRLLSRLRLRRRPDKKERSSRTKTKQQQRYSSSNNNSNHNNNAHLHHLNNSNNNSGSSNVLTINERRNQSQGALTKRAVVDVLKKGSSTPKELQRPKSHFVLTDRGAKDAGTLKRASHGDIDTIKRSMRREGTVSRAPGRLERQGASINLVPLKKEFLDQVVFQPFSLSEKLTRWCCYTDFFDPQAPPEHNAVVAMQQRQRFSVYSGSSLMDWQTFALKRAYRRKTQV